MKNIKGLISSYFYPKESIKPVLIAKEARRIRNMNQLAESMDKINRMLEHVKNGGNEDAIRTWSIIQANMKHCWLDATVEQHTRGNFMFQ